jgi:hypothetical protein
MGDDEKLIGSIRTWLEYERQIKVLQSQTRTLRKNKKLVADQLTTFMRENEVDCFDVKNGKILYTRRTVKAPLNKKTLQAALEKFFSDKATDLSAEALDFLLESRPETVSEQIRLKEENKTGE